MLQRFKQYLIIAVIAGAFYYLLSHHVLFSGMKSFDTFKKDELTLKNTFISLIEPDPEAILRIDALRAGGAGELLVEKGKISKAQLSRILKKIDSN